MSIYEAKSIESKIMNNSHYSNCFNGSDYNSFCEKRNKLDRIRKCYDNIIYYEKNIIEEDYNYKNKEKDLSNQNELFRRNLEIEKKNNNNRLDIEEKNLQNELNKLEKEFELYKTKFDCDLQQINEDISNIKKVNIELKSKKDAEIELLKKEKLFELKNEYRLKLLKYKNMKELEKELNEKNEEIKRKQFEAEKEIKFNEMKNKAELVQKIIAICKSIQLN